MTAAHFVRDPRALAVPVGTILARGLAEHKDCGRFFRDGRLKRLLLILVTDGLRPQRRTAWGGIVPRCVRNIWHDVREKAPTGARRGKKHPQGKCKKHPQGPGEKARRVYNQRAVPSGWWWWWWWFVLPALTRRGVDMGGPCRWIGVNEP
jgi:hypothetical protein